MPLEESSMTAAEDEFRRELVRGAELCGGRYTIEHRISCGGFSAVYSARTRNGRDVALKILDARHSARAIPIKRMENEMRIGVALSSIPGVVRPLDHGVVPELSDRPFIAFELVQGRGLDVLLDTKALLPLRACEIASRIASTLVQLHGRGVIHRDIKPSNVLVDDAHGLDVRVIDFGFAFSAGLGPLPDTSGLTGTFEVTGTVHYMAPEHCMAAPPTPGFDIYGLACTLWELVIGHGPYLGHDPEEVLRRKRDRSFPTPSIFEQSADLDDELAQLIDDGMRRDPSERIATAEEFRCRLDMIIERLRGCRGGTHPTMAATIAMAPRRRWRTSVLLGCAVLVTGTGVASMRATSTATRVDTVANSTVVATPILRAVASPRASSSELRVGFPPTLLGRVDTPHALPSPAHPATVDPAPDAPSSPPSRIKTNPTESRAKVAPKGPARPEDPGPSCADVRDDLRRAQQRSEWNYVLKVSETRSTCWSGVDRALLRIHALRSLGRYRACVAEGQSFSQTEVQRSVSSCRARLKEP